MTYPPPLIANQLQSSCKPVAFPVANPVAKGLYEGFRASHRDIEVFTKGKLVPFANVRNTRQGWFATGFATGNATVATDLQLGSENTVCITPRAYH